MNTKNILVGLGLLGLLTATHCSSKFADYCDAVKACEGGNDADRDACIEGQRTREDVAGDYGCSDQFDTLTDCLKNASCKDNGSSGTKRLDTSACSTQSQALSACETAASGKKSNSTSSSSSSSSGGVQIDAGP